MSTILPVPTVINVLPTITLTGHVMFSVNQWLASTIVLIRETKSDSRTGMVQTVIHVLHITSEQTVLRSAMTLLIKHVMNQETDNCAKNTTILKRCVTRIANQ